MTIPISQSLNIVKQYILRADENIDETGVWQAYLRIVEFIKNTEMANQGSDRKPGSGRLTLKDVPPPQEANMI